MTLRDILIEAGLGADTIEYIEQGLREEDLVVVPTSKVYLRVRLPWRGKKRTPKSKSGMSFPRACP